MTKATKTWLIAAACLLLTGGILFTAEMQTLGWDFTKLSKVIFETNTYRITQSFEGIALDTDTADLIFLAANDGKCRVECHEEENAKHTVCVQDNTLTIRCVDSRSVYDYIGLHFDSPEIRIYLPRREYKSLLIREDTGRIEIPEDLHFGDADIEASTGDIAFFASVSGTLGITTDTGSIRADNTAVGALDLSVTTGTVTVSDVNCEGDVTVGVSTGKTFLSDIACRNVISSGNTGDIYLDHVIAAEKISIERSTGKVKFDASDAPAIYVRTDTGDVTGSLLTDKVFITQTDTGDVDVPKTQDGGRCEITTSTGDIALTIG